MRYISALSPMIGFIILGVVSAILISIGIFRSAPSPIGEEDIKALYRTKASTPKGPLAVYFIGHSLIARDMPSMLAQLAPDGHRYESQLGWGALLEAHWDTAKPLRGAEKENDHARFREAHDAVSSGDYDVLVLTERIGIRNAIRNHRSFHYLSLWAEQAIASNPDVRIYLYETWHDLDIQEGWLERIDGDLSTYWETEIVDRALATGKVDSPIYIIPGGQVMASFTRELELRGSVDGLKSREDLFKDKIHFNSIGAYLIALTHYAVLYGRSPLGLPHDLVDANGNQVPMPGPEAARLMQEVVWKVVTGYQRTGVQG